MWATVQGGAGVGAAMATTVARACLTELSATVARACLTALSASESWKWSSACGCCTSAKSSRRVAHFVAIFKHEIQLIKWLPVLPPLAGKSPELPALT